MVSGIALFCSYQHFLLSELQDTVLYSVKKECLLWRLPSKWQLAKSNPAARSSQAANWNLFPLIRVIRGWFLFVATELLLSCVCGSCRFLHRA
jgi:hypothetical protein